MYKQTDISGGQLDFKSLYKVVEYVDHNIVYETCRQPIVLSTPITVYSEILHSIYTLYYIYSISGNRIPVHVAHKSEVRLQDIAVIRIYKARNSDQPTLQDLIAACTDVQTY